MLWVTSGANAYNWSVSNIATTRPAAAMGTAVTPGASNVKGSWVSLLTGAQVARDIFGLLININSVATSAQIKSALVDIGVDPSGGTSYTVLLPDLLACSAGPYNVGAGGVWYWFPIWVRAGSRIGARAQTSNATAGSSRVAITGFGSPRDRRLIRVGTRVESIGVTTASSSGTTVTSGTTSDGAWTSLGTLSRSAWFWQFGFDCANTAMSAAAYHCDIGIGDVTNKVVVIDNGLVNTTTSEQVNKMPSVTDVGKYAPAGTEVFGRMQCSTTPVTPLSLAAYAVGG